MDDDNYDLLEIAKDPYEEYIISDRETDEDSDNDRPHPTIIISRTKSSNFGIHSDHNYVSRLKESDEQSSNEEDEIQVEAESDIEVKSDKDSNDMTVSIHEQESEEDSDKDCNDSTPNADSVRRRGRPRKHFNTPVRVPTGRPRGRPPKQPQNVVIPSLPVRGRGRPRIHPVVQNARPHINILRRNARQNFGNILQQNTILRGIPRRGRPPLSQKILIPTVQIKEEKTDNDDESDQGLLVQHNVSRRGRPRKVPLNIRMEPGSSNAFGRILPSKSESDTPSNENGYNMPPIPRHPNKRGRPRKDWDEYVRQHGNMNYGSDRFEMEYTMRVKKPREDEDHNGIPLNTQYDLNDSIQNGNEADDELNASDIQGVSDGNNAENNSKRGPHTPELIALNQVDLINCTDDATKREYNNRYNSFLLERNKTLVKVLNEKSEEIQRLRDLANHLGLNKKMSVNKSTTNNSSLPSSTVSKSTQDASNAEMCRAFCLHKLNTKFYKYAKQHFDVPLPSINEVQSWSSKIPVIAGYQTEFIRMMEFDRKLMEKNENLCVLQISEIKLIPKYEYDNKSDCILGPYQTLHLLTAVGLCSDWKYLVHLRYDSHITKTILFSIIQRLHSIGYTVLACVSPYVDKDHLWTDLNIVMSRSYFPHPVTNECIYAFYNIDDILVHMRNRLIDVGFVTDTGKVNKTPFVKIQDNPSKGSLSKSIVEPKITNDSQLLSLTEELFSSSSANILRTTLGDDEIATTTAGFLDLINLFRDLMTSRLTNSEKDDMSYGQNLTIQNHVLTEMHDTIYKLRCVGTPNLEQFQKAIIITIQSLRNLYTITANQYGLKLIGTSILCQEVFKDCYKNYISRKSLPSNLMSPLQGIDMLKSIYLNATTRRETIFSEYGDFWKSYFYINQPIDVTKSEEFYVQLLYSWLYAKDSETSLDDIQLDVTSRIKLYNCMEQVFINIQGDDFNVTKGVLMSLKKLLLIHHDLKSVNNINSLIENYIFQRHLLRIHYLNSKYAT